MLVAIPLFERFTALDAVGPYEVLQRVPSIDVVFVGHQRGEVRSDNGMLGMTVDKAFTELTQPDVVVFPGGIGTRVLINDAEVLDWVREAHEHSRFTTSVCTGGLVLAAAGLLDGSDGDHALAGAGAVQLVGRAVRAAAGRRAPAAADHHRGRGVQRHRHGVAAGRAAGRTRRRRSQPVDDRVRPRSRRSMPAIWARPPKPPRSLPTSTTSTGPDEQRDFADQRAFL